MNLRKEPVSNAWTAEFKKDQLVFAQFGIQAKQNIEIYNYINEILESFKLSDGPIHLDRAIHYDIDDYINYIFLAYWDDDNSFKEWCNNPIIEKYWGENSDILSDIGIWREVMFIPTNHIETIHSGENYNNGVSHFLPLKYTKVHEYWGAMRDRIPASKDYNLKSLYKKDNLIPVVSDTKGKRVRVHLPDNFCLIRTAQSWSECSDDERTTYLNLVEPVLKEGEDYIRNNPTDTGCLSSKFVYETTIDGEILDKSCTIAYFLSLSDLEEWAKKHPSHLSIYRTFHQMLKKYNNKTELALWHEVSVLKNDLAIFEYINCHSKTGLLPYSELQVLTY